MTRRRKNSRTLPLSTIVVLAVALVSWFSVNSSCHAESEMGRIPSMSVDDELLNVTTPNDLPSKIIDYTGFRVSFNRDTHNPNWVAWELTRDEASGDEPRSNNFQRDYDVRGCADPSDYKYSGYDRGHMAPAADMKWSPQAMRESFLMTNICPQAKSLNTGTWRKLEEKCRGWAIADSAIFIVCGPVPGDTVDMKIGENEVVVPRRFFKVILSPYAVPPRGIGFIMNNGTVKGGMQAAACSIDEVERVTGYDFFASLPDSIEDIVESQCKFNFWSNLR